MGGGIESVHDIIYAAREVKGVERELTWVQYMSAMFSTYEVTGRELSEVYGMHRAFN